MLAWQRRPLEPLYPVIYLDAMIVKVKDGGHTRNKAAHIAVGVDMAGVKHVLGIWVQPNEGASFWASVCADLANRGVKDVLIVCCDGLTGFPEAIAATWSQAAVQTCVVHLTPQRAAVRVLRRPQGRGRGAQADLHRTRCRRCPRRVGRVRRLGAGEEEPNGDNGFRTGMGAVHPVFGVPARAAPGDLHDQLNRVVEYQLRKIIKHRGQFPNDAAVVKLLWLAICNIEDKRAAERAKERGQKQGRTAPGRLVEGQVVTNWKKALEQLALVYPDRIERYL